MLAVCANAQRATWLAPLKASLLESPIESFSLRLPGDFEGPWNDPGLNPISHPARSDSLCRDPQVRKSAIGARTDENPVDGCARDSVTCSKPHIRQRVLHGLRPQGISLVCGDSHTATHGAVGALAWGIGASEMVHVMATQCLVQKKPKQMLVRFEGSLAKGVVAKDLILWLIGQLGASAGTG
ncbi:MAG: hypothetical protein EBW47_11865, partial [Betaproteobacteria bacterium]|nr:hypothetical protein [Betaproteobacteria bacterium]